MQTPAEGADHRAELARLEAIRALPVEPYVGRTLAEAHELAGQEEREIRIFQALDGPRRADLVFRRLNVALDADGVVTGADAG